MKKNNTTFSSYIYVILVVLLTGCHIYMPMQEEETAQASKPQPKVGEEDKSKEKPTYRVLPLDEAIQKMQKSAYYKLHTTQDETIIQFQANQGDSLSGFIGGNEKKPVQIAKKDITQVDERQFSKPKSDWLTISIYLLLGAGVAVLAF